MLFVELDNCGAQCLQTAQMPYRWFRSDQLSMDCGQSFWGPEPSLLLMFGSRGSDGGAGQSKSIDPLPLMGRITELSLNQLKHNKKWCVVQTLECTELHLAMLFDDFVQHCYPSQYMTKTMFLDYFHRSSIKLDVTSCVHTSDRLYNAFCFTNGLYITFRDFLYNLLALDRRCLHGGIAGELRTRCIFRYYTKTLSNQMEYGELIRIFEDINSSNRKKMPDTPINMVESLYRSEKIAKDSSLPMELFVQLVGKLAIRGTATIYRITNHPLIDIGTYKLYPMLMGRAEMLIDRILAGRSIPRLRMKQCLPCSTPIYTLSFNSIIINVNRYWSLSYETELSKDIIPRMNQVSLNRSLQLVAIGSNRGIHHQIRSILRRFSAAKHGFPLSTSSVEMNDDILRWERKEDRMQLTDKILRLCMEACDVARRGPRVIKCTSPVYVFGDIHGNYRDLMIYDHLFWRSAPNGFVCNSLFLGDYVDRGDNSVECVLYLMCMKAILPERFHLLRGNHEVRQIQQQFTFYRECVDKFGPLGTNIWDAFNQWFDCLPLCGIIDEQVYVAHGGIPASVYRVEDLYTMPVPMATPNLQSKVAWEILWNDPVSRNEYQEFIHLYRQNQNFPICPRGFLTNIKRGTAFYFSEEAFDYFAEQNSIGYVIRAHEVIPSGFQFLMDGKTTTIFSCSNYCGAANESAVMFIERGKMRIIKIETNKEFIAR